jgi:hypothetical protein
MILESIRAKSSNRFTEVLAYLNFITSLEPQDPRDSDPMEVKILRGLFYVHLYAALEKTVNDLIQQILLLIESDQPKNKHLILPFNVISMYRNWMSLRDVGFDKCFTKAFDLFCGVESEEIADISETIFSYRLQNVWAETLDEVLSAFGVEDFIITPRDRTAINEVVEKRNAVAHGRESAVDIGERFRSDRLRERLFTVETVCSALIDHMQLFFEGKKFIRQNDRTTYLQQNP